MSRASINIIIEMKSYPKEALKIILKIGIIFSSLNRFIVYNSLKLNMDLL